MLSTGLGVGCMVGHCMDPQLVVLMMRTVHCSLTFVPFVTRLVGAGVLVSGAATGS